MQQELEMNMRKQEREFLFTDKDFQFLAQLANVKTGIQLPQQKKDMVYGRLARRLRALSLDSFYDYCHYLQRPENAGEISNLVNAITTNLTKFFRESHHFDHLHEVVSEHARTARQRRLRIWSAGCSSGMEPYSIAMTVLSAIPDISKWDFKVLASDIDTNMVATGLKGEYSENDVGDVPEKFSMYMRSLPNGRVVMSDTLKKHISFRELNLLEAWPMKGPFDIIFCRNVIIYFDKDTKKTLAERYAGILKPEGILYIGHSENLHGVTDKFKLLGRTCYQKVTP